MRKNECIEGVVEKVSFPDKGILHVPEDPRPVHVKGVVPGQRVRVRVKKQRSSRIEAELAEVLVSSPLEQAPACPFFGRCGGCRWQSVPYETSLEIKNAQMRELLMQGAEAAGMAPLTYEGIAASPAVWGYRNKMEFSFGDQTKDGPLELGLHCKGSFYDILTVSDCRIVDADFRRILQFTRDHFAPYHADGILPLYHRLRHEGVLRHLLVRKAARTGEILVDVVTSSQAGSEVLDPILADYAKGLKSLPFDGVLKGVLHTVNDAVSDIIRDDGTRVLLGTPVITEELLGLHFEITPFSFFQTNSYSAELIYEKAREYVREGGGDRGVFYDLYSGTGTIAQLMAGAARQVYGVEIVPEAVEAAVRNAAHNGIHNCSFLCGDVLRALDELPEPPDGILLDPPREGVHPKALAKILDYGVPSIVYISCKPSSLAEELAAFAEKGYALIKAAAVDQFPWTANTELIALFQRR